MASDSVSRGSKPRKIMNPMTRHTPATARLKVVVLPMVSQRCSAASSACSGPGASVSLTDSMNGMLLVAAPAAVP